MVYSALSNDVSTVSQFTRRKAITITTGGTSTPANYQVKLTIAYESEMEVSFADVRFNTKVGTYIDYWMESHTDSTTATIWIELPDAITDPGSDTIWMYYGNSSLSDGSDVADTMLDGDDFNRSDSGTVGNSWTEDTDACWEISSNELKATWVSGSDYDDCYRTLSETDQIISTKMKLSATNQRAYFTIFDSTSIQGAFQFGNDGVIYYINSSGWISTTKSYATDTWYELIITYHVSSGLYDYSIPTLSWSVSGITGYTATTSEIMRYSTGAGTLNFYSDNYFVRKYIANEPTPSYGTAQHQRRVPRFL